MLMMKDGGVIYDPLDKVNKVHLSAFFILIYNKMARVASSHGYLASFLSDVDDDRDTDHVSMTTSFHSHSITSHLCSQLASCYYFAGHLPVK